MYRTTVTRFCKRKVKRGETVTPLETFLCPLEIGKLQEI